MLATCGGRRDSGSAVLVETRGMRSKRNYQWGGAGNGISDWCDPVYDLKRRTRCPTAYRPCCFVICATYLAKMTPCVVALQSTKSFTKTQYSMTPKAVYFVVVTRLIVLLV